MNDIIGMHDIPRGLIGAKDSDILAWARSILRGHEPRLTQTQIREIREGKNAKIFLEPKIPGFFLPDGEFVPAYSHRPSIGSDMREAEERWQLEEQIDAWVDDENKRFNKSCWSKSSNQLLELWEHGKRIDDFASGRGIPLAEIFLKLEQRGSEDDYESMKHEFCVAFYRWKRDLKPDDSVLSLNWKKLAHIIMFGKSDDAIKEHALRHVVSAPFNELTSPEISLLLQDNLGKESCRQKFSDEEKSAIMETRARLKKLEEIVPDQAVRVVDIIRKRGTGVAASEPS